MSLVEVSRGSPSQVAVFPRQFWFDNGTERFGDASIWLTRQALEASEHYRIPITRQTTEEKFHALVTEWKNETQFMSSTTSMVLHKAYQEIIGMGPPVIRLLLSELRTNPDHWFAALKALTGADPVPAADRGRLGAMARAWLDWGRRRGFSF